jgi:nucleoside permease NupC
MVRNEHTKAYASWHLVCAAAVSLAVVVGQIQALQRQERREVVAEFGSVVSFKVVGTEI